eukprot:2491391-Pyramimonas_sp.AAC.1
MPPLVTTPPLKVSAEIPSAQVSVSAAAMAGVLHGMHLPWSAPSPSSNNATAMLRSQIRQMLQMPLIVEVRTIRLGRQASSWGASRGAIRPGQRTGVPAHGSRGGAGRSSSGAPAFGRQASVHSSPPSANRDEPRLRLLSLGRAERGARGLARPDGATMAFM